MNTTEIKTTIKNLLEDTPEEGLVAVLEFLKEIKSSPEKSNYLTGNLKMILNDDKELLERLSK